MGTYSLNVAKHSFNKPRTNRSLTGFHAIKINPVLLDITAVATFHFSSYPQHYCSAVAVLDPENAHS